uniref:Immediate early response 3-interacting protein 1 n=1 Tax=Oncorhynchus tshawytscha TaxID=74940 RepID=A0A8C8EW00_ONCTS
MAFTLYSLIQAVILCVNAVAVLHEDRFLSKIGWGVDQSVGGFGDEPGIKVQLMNLVRSVRTVMREKTGLNLDAELREATFRGQEDVTLAPGGGTLHAPGRRVHPHVYVSQRFSITFDFLYYYYSLPHLSNLLVLGEAK